MNASVYRAFSDELVKIAWESAQAELRNGKLHHVFRGSHEATMTMAKARGVKLKPGDPSTGVDPLYREGSVEITDPKERQRAKKDLTDSAKRDLKRKEVFCIRSRQKMAV